jgi:very-short-patch-repair endonuclease
MPCQKWLRHQLKHTTSEVVDLYFALKQRGFEPDLEKFDGHKHVDIVFERPKLHIEVDGIQHNQSSKQALSDLKRTFHSMIEGYITLRIPNQLVRNELNQTADYLVEYILERYYKHI